MLTRREWLKFMSAGVFGAAWCAEGADAAPAGSVKGLDRIAGAYAAKGWGLWQGRSRVQGWQTDNRGAALSITKTLAGLAVAKAVAQGKFTLDEPLSDTFSEWRSDPAKRRITPRMLLQQTSGLESGAGALYKPALADKGRVALALRVVNTPGSFFRYGPSHWEVLAEFLQRRLGRESLERYLQGSVMRAVGISTPEWRSDVKGRFYLSTGTKLTAEDLGKLGRTLARLLRGENTDGFNAAAFANVIQPSSANPMFGGGLWRNLRANRPGSRAIEVEDSIDPAPTGGFWQGACLSRRHPADLVALVGSSGQRVFIWPSHDQVFARLGTSRNWKDAPLLNALA